MLQGLPGEGSHAAGTVPGVRGPATGRDRVRRSEERGPVPMPSRGGRPEGITASPGAPRGPGGGVRRSMTGQKNGLSRRQDPQREE